MANKGRASWPEGRQRLALQDRRLSTDWQLAQPEEIWKGQGKKRIEILEVTSWA